LLRQRRLERFPFPRFLEQRVHKAEIFTSATAQSCGKPASILKSRRAWQTAINTL
jgi:hypothetical protein